MWSQDDGPTVRSPVRHGTMTRGGCTTRRYPKSISRYLPDKSTGATNAAFEEEILDSRQAQIGPYWPFDSAGIGDVGFESSPGSHKIPARSRAAPG